jgi:hypothetical protein
MAAAARALAVNAPSASIPGLPKPTMPAVLLVILMSLCSNRAGFLVVRVKRFDQSKEPTGNLLPP